MKYKVAVLVLAITIPGIVWAGVNFLNTDPVYIVSNTDREDTSAPVLRNFRLEWNESLGKFNLLLGDERMPITIDETMSPLNLPPPLPDEPVYYSDDVSV